MTLSSQQLQSGSDGPFDLWRLHLTGSQRDIGRGLADFALEHRYLTGDGPQLAEDDEQSLCKLFETHAGPLSERARGIAHRFAEEGISRSRYTLPVVDEPPGFACSAAVMTSACGPAMVRNFDFTLRPFADLVGMPSPSSRPMVDPVSLMVLEPSEGRSTIAMVSMDLFLGAFDGINDAGFCAALLSLSNESAGPAAPRFDRFNELAIVRIMLDRCVSVPEAIEVFRDIPKCTTFLPCHYIVADRHADSAVLEWDGETAHVARGRNRDPLVCTNHPLAIPQAADDMEAVPGILSSADRFRLLTSTLQGTTPDRRALWHAARQVRMDAFAADGDVLGGTLWTSLYCLDPPGLEISVLKGTVAGQASYTDPLNESFAPQSQ